MEITAKCCCGELDVTMLLKKISEKDFVKRSPVKSVWFDLCHELVVIRLENNDKIVELFKDILV